MKKLTPFFARPIYMLALCVLTTVSLAQKQKSAILKYNQTPYEGRVFLTDGSEIEGEIVFNDNDGIVTLYNGNESHSFNSRRLIKFEFLDEALFRYRRFYSLEFTDPETGLTDSEFFEILKELPTFIVVARIDRIKTEARKDLLKPRSSPLLVDRKSKKFTQTETIYFVNRDGDFQPYLRIVEKEFDGDLLDYNETNNKVLDADLFEKYTGAHFSALAEYAKQHKLSFRRKSGIVRLLDEYEGMITR